MAAYGLVPKKMIWDELPRHIGHVCENKQNSLVNIFVRSEFVTACPAARPTAPGDHYTRGKNCVQLTY